MVVGQVGPFIETDEAQSIPSEPHLAQLIQRGPQVSTTAGTVTYTDSIVLSTNHYSGTYKFSELSMEDTYRPTAPHLRKFNSGYRGHGHIYYDEDPVGTIWGHGRAENFGLNESACCHGFTFPDLTVTGNDFP